MNASKQSLRILLFGATGRTGKIFLQMALDKGYQVTAIARSPAQIKIEHPNLIVVQGNVMQFQSFRTIGQNHNVVVSCIGVSSTKPTTLYSQGTANILKAMNENKISRLLCISAAAVETSPKLPLFLRLISKYVVQRIFRHPYSDAHQMEVLLRNSNTNWTSVRPPVLKDKAFTGNYRYAVNDWLEKCISINRSDLAFFLLENITNSQTYKSIVEVAN
jgi:putative NADH-flavin reductase